MSLYTMPISVTREKYADIITRAMADAGVSDIRLGITGSRELPTEPQEYHLGLLIHTAMRLTRGDRLVHHGCATGTDETAHQYALSIPDIRIHGYPGYGANYTTAYRMKIRPDEFTKLHPAKRYGERNHDIIRASNLLIACPQYPERDPRSARSGTWQTVRLSRRSHIPAIIISSNGHVFQDTEGR
jgi:hypothetical protein